jgi:U6 snRNA-associated Sm-like protein LSm7
VSNTGIGGDRGSGGPPEKKKKESIVDLAKYLDKPIRVKFQGGREGQGISSLFIIT